MGALSIGPLCPRDALLLRRSLKVIDTERSGMADCPSCEADPTEWAFRLERAPAASSPKVGTCPECAAVLGVSDYE